MQICRKMTFKIVNSFNFITRCYQYEQNHMHMSIEWHRGLPQPPKIIDLAKNTVFMIINIQAQYKLKNNKVWANYAYLAPRDNFIGCQMVYFNPPNAKQSFKNEPVWAMRKCMVSMATHDAIQEWGCAYKITHISAATCPRHLNMVSNQNLDSGLSSIVAYANY